MSRPSIFDDLSIVGERAREISRVEGRGCECCGSTTAVARSARGCAYPYDGKIGDENDPNYATLCEACWIDERQHWEDLWREYYGGVM